MASMLSLWLAIGAGITLCGSALFELVRTRGSSAVLVVAMLAGAAVAFSVAGLATRHEDEHHPAACTDYFCGSGGSSYDFTPSSSYFPNP
jgi:hypothetical protein